MLIEIIKEYLEKHTFLRFDDFIRLVLYHPLYGYYSKALGIGKRGDFITSPCIHPIFGETIGNCVWNSWMMQNWNSPIRILELGGGTGYLAHDILTYLKKNGIPVEYMILEKSKNFVEKSMDLLVNFDVVFYENLQEIPDYGEVFIIANEFFDAFPFRRFVYSKGSWEEIVVTIRGSRLTFDIVPAEESDYLKKFKELQDVMFDNQIIDISPEAYEFTVDLFSRFSRGFFLIIDYGDRRRNLVRNYPFGTMTVIKGHLMLNNPFLDLGDCDISYYVDFDIFFEVGEIHRVKTIFWGDQGSFLMKMGILNILREWEKKDEREKMKARFALKSLIFKFEKTYKVFLGGKGVN